MWSPSDQPSRPSHPRGWGGAGPHVDLFPLPSFDVGPQWVAMLRGNSWLLPHNGFRPLLLRGICFIGSQACSRPVSTFTPSAQLVLNSTPNPMVIFAPSLAECSLASKTPLPIAPHAVLMLLTSCMTSYSPCCRGILHARAWLLVVVSLLGGPTSVTLRAAPGMVCGGTIVGIQIPFCSIPSGSSGIPSNSALGPLFVLVAMAISCHITL